MPSPLVLRAEVRPEDINSMLCENSSTLLCFLVTRGPFISLVDLTLSHLSAKGTRRRSNNVLFWPNDAKEHRDSRCYEEQGEAENDDRENKVSVDIDSIHISSDYTFAVVLAVASRTSVCEFIGDA